MVSETLSRELLQLKQELDELMETDDTAYAQWEIICPIYYEVFKAHRDVYWEMQK